MKLETNHIEFSKADIRRGLILPSKLDTRLAEFLGIMVGDGNLRHSFRKQRTGTLMECSEIRISGNKKEWLYHLYITSLFKNLFKLKLYYQNDTAPGAVLLRINSKGLVEYLSKICGLILNRKGHKLRIPEIIRLSNKEIKCSFLRGLADTDYSVSFKKKSKKGYTYPVIKATFESKKLVKDLEDLYKELKLPYCTIYDEKRYDPRFKKFWTSQNIYLNGRNNIDYWLSNIGFSNYKFQRKVNKWQTDGVCPPGY